MATCAKAGGRIHDLLKYSATRQSIMKKLILVGTVVLVAGLAMVVAMADLESPAVGSTAPEFRLQDQNGEWRSLSDYRGKWLALYFYPKDDTGAVLLSKR
jgi:cytochrome oxidase Cu insertion factor (SCO1/SenC/PrrC family)